MRTNGLGLAWVFGSMGAGLLLAACQGPEPSADETPNIEAGGAPSAVVAELRSTEKRQASDATEAAQAAQAEQEFAFRFLQQLPAHDNVAFSPHSLSVSFAMLTDAAAGETLAQIQKAFRFAEIDEQFQRSQNALLQSLSERSHETAAASEQGSSAQLLTQSSDVWLRADAPPRADFLDTLARYYGAGIHHADFAAHPEEVREAINDKVSTDTHGLIPQLLPPKALAEDTVVVLTSALYFKAPWAAPFRTATAGDFHGLDGKLESASMLSQLTTLPYYAGNRFVSVALPYAGDDLSMVLLVPDADAYDDVRAALSGDVLSEVVAGLEQTRVALTLPKFKLESSEIPTRKALEKLGLAAAFSREEADFPKLQSPKVEQVYVKEVLHQATVEIDEHGTEASAATAVIGAGGGSAGPSAQPKPVIVNVDHPFFFVIRDNPTGSVLFAGQVLKP